MRIVGRHLTISALPKFLFIFQIWESSLRWTELSGGLFFCIDVELWWAWVMSALWTSLRYVLQSVQSMLLVGGTAGFWKLCLLLTFIFNRHSCADYSKWHWPGIFFLRLLPQTLQCFPCVLNSMLLATGCLLVFCLSKEYFDDKRSSIICPIDLLIFTCAATGIVNCQKWPQFFDLPL